MNDEFVTSVLNHVLNLSGMRLNEKTRKYVVVVAICAGLALVACVLLLAKKGKGQDRDQVNNDSEQQE